MILLFGLFIGLILGLLGASGGILTVPVLTSFFDVDFVAATGLSLIAVFAATSIGSFLAFKKNKIDVNVCFFVILGGLIATSLGSTLIEELSKETAMLFYAIICIFLFIKSWFPSIFNKKNNSIEKITISHDDGSTGVKNFSKVKLILLGSVGGILTVLLGIGGGFIYVPFYRYVVGMDMGESPRPEGRGFF